MLSFFRKYQRIFFLVVAVITIASFSFFGTFGTFSTESEVPDRVLGKSVDGRALSLREIDTLRRFLSLSGESNLLNDGVIEQEFLKTNRAALIAERYAQALLPDVKERVEKIRKFQPYVHPQAPFIRQDEVWKRFSPQILGRLNLLKERAEEADISSFSLLCALCLDQMAFPSHLVRRVLFFQESQHEWVQKDPELMHRNLALSGFETLEEWLGPHFLDIACQFIYNTACMAEKKGFKVSKKEVRIALENNVRESLRKLHPQKEISSEEVKDQMQRQLYALGLQESSALDIWQKVMLFRHYLHAAGEKAAAVLPQDEKENMPQLSHIVLFELPEELRFSNFRASLEFEFYLDAVAIKEGLALPKALRPVSEVEKEFPELVQRRYKLKWQEASKEKLLQRLSLKETWDWELEEANWDKLQKQFPNLAKPEAKTREERFALLDKLEAQERFKIDQFAREEIADGHPEWIEEALRAAPEQEQEVLVRLKAGSLPFARIEPKELLERLDKEETFSIASPDQEIFYKITVQERAKESELLTFADALKEGVLAALLDRRLEAAYTQVRDKEPKLFKNEDGSWKSFSDAKDQVGALLYAQILSSIEKECRDMGHSLPVQEGRQPLEFYATHRLCAHMNEARRREVRGEAQEESLWRLVRSERAVSQKDRVDFPKESLLSLTELTWSPLAVSEQGNISFFQLIKRTPDEVAFHEEQRKQQELIAQEAERDLFQNILNEIVEKNAIHLDRNN